MIHLSKDSQKQTFTNIMKKTTAISNDRFDWIDLAKGMLMLMVFTYHSEVIYGNGHSWSYLFAPIRMSVFFFLSGYLFTRSIGTVSFRKKSMQVLRSVVIPYLAYMTIFFLPK